MQLLEVFVERVPDPVRVVRQNWVTAYGLALAVIAIATLVRFATVGSLTAPFIPFFVAAVATAGWFGTGNLCRPAVHTHRMVLPITSVAQLPTP
jgi:hypothetical protein